MEIRKAGGRGQERAALLGKAAEDVMIYFVTCRYNEEIDIAEGVKSGLPKPAPSWAPVS
jgi:hypothetical protein